MSLFRRIGKRELFSFGLEKEIKGIVHRHFCHEINFDTKLGGFLRKHHPCQIVCLRVLLPVNKMLARNHSHRITQHARAGMGTGPQSDNLRPQINGPIIAIMGNVI